MRSRRFRRPSPAMAVAIVALVFAMAGTGIAASQYIITSASQIKPSVRRELRSEAAHAAAIKLAATGAHAVVARIRSTGPVTVGAEAAVPLRGNTWTQHPEELNMLVGTVNVNPQGCVATGGAPVLRGSIDGTEVLFESGLNAGGVATKTEALEWEGFAETNYESSHPHPTQEWIFEPTATATHTFTATVAGSCMSGGPVIVNSLAVDVIALK
jgi:hypothetical protein